MIILRNALLALIAVMLICYFFLLDWIILHVAEDQMTQAYGAEVNIEQVDLSLFPASVTLKHIQLTDHARPMQNTVVIDHAFADVELLPLLKQKLIAQELQINRVAFAQPREKAGKVIRQPDPNAFGFPSKDDIPSVDELLANSPLKTTKAVEQAQQAYAEHTEELQQQYAALPNQERIDYYKAEVQKLKETDFNDPAALLNAKAKFEQLKEEMRADKAKIDEFRQSAKIAKQDLSQAVSDLKQAPQDDYALLKGVFSGDQAALQQVTQSLFGEKATQYTQYLTLAIQTIAPMLNNKSDSQTADLVDQDGIPKVWIKKAVASVLVNGELITSDWQNITDQHSLINAATTFSVDAGSNSLWQAFTTSGQFSLDQQGVDAEQQWSLSGINLDSFGLSDSQRMVASIASAVLTSNGKLSVTDNILAGSGNIDLNKLVLKATGSDNFTEALADALEDVSSLAMNIDFSGNIQDPQFSIGSDLDRQLAGAIMTSLDGNQQGKLSELRDQLNTKAASALGDTNAALVQTIDWQTLASGDANTLDELLEAQISSLVDKQKNKLLDKLKSKLGG